MPRHAHSPKSGTEYGRQVAARPGEARSANAPEREVVISVWAEHAFVTNIKTARIAVEPLAVRVIPAALTRITLRKLILDQPILREHRGSDKLRSVR